MVFFFFVGDYVILVFSGLFRGRVLLFNFLFFLIVFIGLYIGIFVLIDDIVR